MTRQDQQNARAMREEGVQPLARPPNMGVPRPHNHLLWKGLLHGSHVRVYVVPKNWDTSAPLPPLPHTPLKLPKVMADALPPKT